MIARATMFGSVSSSITSVHARSLTATCGRAADAAAACRLPAAVGSRCTSASMNGVSGPSESTTPPLASAVTIRQRRSVSTTRPARPFSSGEVSSSAESTSMCRSLSTDEHSALTYASWWSDPGSAARARSSSRSANIGQPSSHAQPGSA